jgi:hypothetical protein
MTGYHRTTFDPHVMGGKARIKVGSRTAGQWLLRPLWQTFNFKM